MVDTLITGRWIFDAVDGRLGENAFVRISGDRIVEIGKIAALPEELAECIRRYDYPDGCLVPGFVDVHVHLMYGTEGRMSGPRSYDHVNAEDSDELMLLRAVRNAYQHLLAGVTSMRDAGARNRITFDLKDGFAARLFGMAPRVHASGRSLTMTGGHFYFCGEEADGPEECRRAVRRLVKDGADFIKVMGSGGGTYITQPRYASFTVEELRAITIEAARHRKRTTIHALATETIRNALDAGFDCIEHVEFVEPDWSRRYDPEVGKRIADSGCFISPTLQCGWKGRLALENKLEAEGYLSKEEETQLVGLRAKTDQNLYTSGRLHELGVPMVVGTDAIARFGDYALGVALLVRAGFPEAEALMAATRNGARAMDLEDEIGTLEPGKLADMVVVAGNPLHDIKVLEDVTQVVRAGEMVPMSAVALFPLGPGGVVYPRRTMVPRSK